MGKTFWGARFLGEEIVQPPNVFMVKRIKGRNRMGGARFWLSNRLQYGVIDYCML